MMHTFTFSRVVQLQIKTFDKENQCVLLIMEECLDMEHMLLEFQKWKSVFHVFHARCRSTQRKMCILQRTDHDKLALCQEREYPCFHQVQLKQKEDDEYRGMLLLVQSKLAFKWTDLLTSSHLHLCCVSACVSVEMCGRCAHTLLIYCAFMCGCN